jgi:predicted ATPase
MPNLASKPVLVGRDDEIKQLRQHLDSALAGKGTTVFIGGEAGVGKTRLVNEFLNQAEGIGVKVLSGSTNSSTKQRGSGLRSSRAGV